MLRELGHAVHEAAGGAKALARLRSGIQIDAVVSDYMMPWMNGTEVAERLRKTHPQMPILIVTGYAGGDLDLPLPQLAKPFRQVDIAMAIDQLIATP